MTPLHVHSRRHSHAGLARSLARTCANLAHVAITCTQLPNCRWYIKADVDSWINLDRLRGVIGVHWDLRRTPQGSGMQASGMRPRSEYRAEYVGRPLVIWRRVGVPNPVVFMQGGVMLFAQRAARHLASCLRPLGNMTHCPNRVLEKPITGKPGEMQSTYCACASLRMLAHGRHGSARAVLHHVALVACVSWFLASTSYPLLSPQSSPNKIRIRRCYGWPLR